MSLATIKVELELHNVTKDSMVIRDKGLRYAFKFKRGKEDITFYAMVSGGKVVKRKLKEVSEEALTRALKSIAKMLGMKH